MGVVIIDLAHFQEDGRNEAFRLIGQVVAVSVETVRLVDDLARTRLVAASEPEPNESDAEEADIS